MPGLFGLVGTAVNAITGGGGPSKQQKDLYASEKKAVDFGLSQAEGTIPKATVALQDPLNFFKALLTGDRNALASVLGPDVNTLTSQYETSTRSTNEFAPRGGGATAANEEARFTEAGQIQNLFSSARTTGAEGETAIGQILAQLGLGELGVGSNAGGSLSDQLLAQQKNKQDQQAQAGQAVGSLIALLVRAGG